MNQIPFAIRSLQREDREWVAHFLDEHWGSTQMVTRGHLHYGHLLPGFLLERPKMPANLPMGLQDDDATEENPLVQMEKIGLLTYNVEGNQCEIVSLNSLEPRQGGGTALVNELVSKARAAAIKRIWLITTNDNLDALHFWQKRHFVLAALYPNSIERARRQKPQIPIVGCYGIPIRDEIELQMLL
jgi:GNAT superfamily N-acetyltransferase